MKSLNSLNGQMRPLKPPISRTHLLFHAHPNTKYARSQRKSQTPCAALSFIAAPIEVLVGGGALVLTTAGYLAYEALKALRNQSTTQPTTETGTTQPAPLPRNNAVLVFGASGRTGRQIVDELLKSGRTVIAAVRDENRANGAFAPLGISSGRCKSGILFIESGIDVTDASTLSKNLFRGVEQIVCSLGPVFGKTSDGTMGYLDGMSSEAVDKNGVTNIVDAASMYMKKIPYDNKTTELILPMRTDEQISTDWQRLDDVIMGGQSSSTLEAGPSTENGHGIAVWKGQLIVEGGGFCGARTQPMQVDLSKYDGIALRVKGDGQTLKLNIKTDTFCEPEDTYQASFDTLPNGDWVTVYIPWHEFVAVKKARSVPGGPPLDPSKIRQFGLVYSRFAFNGFPNDSYTPGPFEIQFEDGIKAYKSPKPQIVLVSSAGVERNAKIGGDVEARKKDIPIVQLNPGGTLNHKYAGEVAVRSSGFTYTILRPTGMSDDFQTGPALLEFSQGDRISGKVTRNEIASLVAVSLSLPSAAQKTVEVRRSEAADAEGKATDSVHTLRLFLGASQDRNRAKIGLEPFPTPTAPPPPPTEERKIEILNDPRVQAAQQRGNVGGRLRNEEESDSAKTVTSINDGRADISSSRKEIGAVSSPTTDSTRSTVDEDHERAKVREWIRRWRARNLEKQLPQDSMAISD